VYGDIEIMNRGTGKPVTHGPAYDKKLYPALSGKTGKGIKQSVWTISQPVRIKV